MKNNALKEVILSWSLLILLILILSYSTDHLKIIAVSKYNQTAIMRVYKKFSFKHYYAYCDNPKTELRASFVDVCKSQLKPLINPEDAIQNYYFINKDDEENSPNLISFYALSSEDPGINFAMDYYSAKRHNKSFNEELNNN